MKTALYNTNWSTGTGPGGSTALVPSIPFEVSGWSAGGAASEGEVVTIRVWLTDSQLAAASGVREVEDA